MSWHLKPWMQNIVIVPVFCYYAALFSQANPVQPVVSVLAIMLAVRLSGEKTVRHSLQIYAISMFCLASSSLFDLSPVFLIYLGLLLFMVAITLVLLTFQNQDHAMTVSKPDLKRILLSGLLMPILAVPLLLLFFPIMPRTQLPLWNFLNPSVTRTVGYADTVEPGTQSSITESRTLAFRAEMPRQNQPQLYWRGTVFNRTNGVKWTRFDHIPTEQPQFTGQMITQVIFPEPSAVRTLISLDRPATLSLNRVKRYPDGVFEQIGPTGRRLSYIANSLSIGTIVQKNPVNRSFYLQVPDQIPVRVKFLVSRALRDSKDTRAKIEFFENYFRNGGYRYSTRDLPVGDTALEQFLFEKKQGHCEFFASSFALLLRAAGVPCRLVGGYLGGDYNQWGGYYQVTEDKAHVWVEANIEGSGWVRIDPSSFANNAGDLWTDSRSRSFKLRLSMAIDSFNHSWNRSVISYDFEQQINIAHQVSSGLEKIRSVKNLRSLAFFCAVLLLLAGGYFGARRVSLFSSREQRILRHFLRTVGHPCDIALEERIGLFEIASAADNCHVSDFVSIYAGAIYRDRKISNEEYLRLQQILRILKRTDPKTS